MKILSIDKFRQTYYYALSTGYILTQKKGVLKMEPDEITKIVAQQTIETLCELIKKFKEGEVKKEQIYLYAIRQTEMLINFTHQDQEKKK